MSSSKPVKAKRVPVKGNPKRAMQAAADILSLRNYGREQYEYLEDINTNLAMTRQLQRATIQLNVAAIRKLSARNSSCEITEIRQSKEYGELIHQALVLLHEGKYYIFDANHDVDTDEDYKWFTDPRYNEFHFEAPLKMRKERFQASDDIQDGLCALFALMIKKVYEKMPFDQFLNTVTTFTPEEIVQLYMTL